jgi:hypothetical protein
MLHIIFAVAAVETLAGVATCREGGGGMGRQPLPVVGDFTRDGRWSTHDVSVRKKMGGKMRTNSIL